jgi:WD40 repeat protein
MHIMELRRASLLLVMICLGCGGSNKGKTFFDREIEPILSQKCAGNTSGCHSTNEDDPFQFAAGNLDVTSFEAIQKRRDVLIKFGAYPYPLLLIKGVGPAALKLQYGDVIKDIDVQHSGGGILDLGSDAFFTLQNWLENGATENGVPAATPPQQGIGACSPDPLPGFDATKFVNATTQASFDMFKAQVQPILTRHGCNAASCHGAPQSDFYITCGADDNQLAFNFSQAWGMVNGTATDDSQLLRVPLARLAGGRGHTGGDQFPAIDDTEFVTVKTWAAQAGSLAFAQPGETGKQLFADTVQPLLLQRGCAFAACHSPGAFNDFKLRSGIPGFYSTEALQKNYDLLKNDFMALEFPDARRGRAGAKTVNALDPRVATVGGIVHRGGAVLETPDSGIPADPATCPAATGYCVLQAWLDTERADLLAKGQVTSMNAGDPIKIVYVERTAGTATAGRLEFDTFKGGADLKVATTTFAANQVLNPADAGGAQSLLGGCAGLTAGTADVSYPNVANDGTRVVFAARNSVAEPLGVFMVNIDGSNCQRVTPAVPDQNGIHIHNFDPVFAPDGSAIVFASTRGKAGPTKSLVRNLPQSDLWRVSVNGQTVDQGSYEQMTFLSNSEVAPAFMREGRVTMTTEKAGTNFYQLSGRRMNWDLTDYHPLLAQRKESPYADLSAIDTTKPSIGYSAATDVHESSNGDFMIILSDVDPNGTPQVPGGGGALGIFNRSVGPFEEGRVDDGYIASLRVLNGGAATGRAGTASSYRRPAALPDGRIMASFASNASAANFDIVAVDPRDGTNSALFTNGGGKVRVDAVLAYKSPPRVLYANRRQLVFGGSVSADTDHAVLHMPDAPMVFTLLTGNLRRGRPVDDFRAARFLAIYSGGLTPTQLLGTADLADDGSVRVQLPSRTPIILELQDGSHNPIRTMTEEHQLGPGENISMGVSQALFDGVCAGCHGSVSGDERDVQIFPDALTGASQSSSVGSLSKVGP